VEIPLYSISELQACFARGEITASSVSEAYLARIEAVDRNGPKLRAVIEVNPDALEIAAQLDAERASQGPRGPLHGVPVLVKDSIDTGDRMMTTGGSLALQGNVAPHDAFIVHQLRNAGAVILGKTNMSEWGYFRSTRQCTGWSSRGGQTRNPYVLDRTPGGSSSGSGAAVAANLCLAALGAEVDGSVVHPSAMCGLVGLKPTVGLLSRSGIMGICAQQDTAGPMARSVRDVAILMNIMVGADPSDPASVKATSHTSTDYTRQLDPGGLQGARIGVARDFFGFHEGVDGVIEEALRRIAALGAKVIDPVSLGDSELFGGSELTMCLYDFKKQTNDYLEAHPASPARCLADVIRFNEVHRDRVMPYFGQELLLRAEAKGGLDEPEYLEVKATCHRLARDEGIDKAMRDHRLDAIVAPTTGTPAFMIDPVGGDRILGGCFPVPAMAGYPHITFPAGYVDDLPVGLSFFSGAFREADLLRYAFAFEQAVLVQRPPQFLATVGAS